MQYTRIYIITSFSLKIACIYIGSTCIIHHDLKRFRTIFGNENAMTFDLCHSPYSQDCCYAEADVEADAEAHAELDSLTRSY